MYFSLVRADIAAASVLISMGAVLGKTSYIQLIMMGIIEIAAFTANSYLGSKVFKVLKDNVIRLDIPLCE